MLLYNCFCCSEVMDQMFLTVLGAVQGLFKSTLGVASVFDHVVLRPAWGAWRVPHPNLDLVFGVNLDYVDFAGGIFDLRKCANCLNKVNTTVCFLKGIKKQLVQERSVVHTS